MQLPKPPTPSPVRCAIYTRKSTEHRLNIDFNTLENQREVCSAYVTRVTRKGNVVGGGIVSRGMLQNLLSNPLHVGQVRHHGEVFPGEHEAIVDRELWDAVQAVRESRRKVQKSTGPTPNILTGLLFDCVGRRMAIAGERARGRESRYYASEQARWGKRESIKRFRADADSIEEFVVLTVCELLENREKLRNCLSGLDLDGFALKRLGDAGRQASRRLSEGRFDLRRQILTSVLSRVDAATDRVTMVFRTKAVEKFLLWDGLASLGAAVEAKDAAGPHFVMEVPASALRYQRALVYPIEPRDRTRQSKPNPGLVALLREARKAQALMDTRRDLSLVQAARVYRRGPSTFARILRLNYLAPDIVAAILDGMQPAGLHRKKLLLCTLPMDWALQRKLLGFDARGDAMDSRVERAERLQQRQQDRIRTAELQPVEL